MPNSKVKSKKSGRKTPCIGVCSTVYGDLVCRGCKRFAHEVIEWNGYEEEQKATVWQRLTDLRDQAVNEHLEVFDATRLRAQVVAHGVPHWESDSLRSLAYALLWRGASRMNDLAAYGLRSKDSRPGPDAARELLQAIEAEYYMRSQAHYERNYRTVAR